MVRETFGVETTVVVKSARELHTIVDTAPFVPNEAEQSRCLVVFAMQAAAMHALQALKPLLQPNERLGITPNAAYLLCPQGLRRPSGLFHPSRLSSGRTGMEPCSPC